MLRSQVLPPVTTRLSWPTLVLFQMFIFPFFLLTKVSWKNLFSLPLSPFSPQSVIIRFLSHHPFHYFHQGHQPPQNKPSDLADVSVTFKLTTDLLPIERPLWCTAGHSLASPPVSSIAFSLALYLSLLLGLSHLCKPSSSEGFSIMSMRITGVIFKKYKCMKPTSRDSSSMELEWSPGSTLFQAAQMSLMCTCGQNKTKPKNKK